LANAPELRERPAAPAVSDCGGDDAGFRVFECQCFLESTAKVNIFKACLLRLAA
jgi:hypothetical protein